MQRVSDPVRIAAIGLNFGAHAAAEIHAHPKMSLDVVCDLDEEKARRISDKLGGVRHTSSYESILADPKIEAVALFTPPHVHGLHITMAARAGKHVVVTKPFEISSTKAEAAIKAAEAAGIVLMSNSPPPRYIGHYGIIKRAVDTGAVGRIVHIATYTWALYDNMDPDGTWYDDPDACPGGPLYRLGIYAMNLANVFLGEPVEVYAQQSWIRSRRPTPDHSSMIVKYKDGSQTTITVSLSVGGAVYPDTAVVAGTGGLLVLNPAFASSDAPKKDVLLVQGRQHQMLDWNVGLGGYDYDGLYQFLREGTRPEINIRAAMNGVKIVEAARVSLKEKRAISV